jgi:CBS domain-containing protein
MTDNSLRTRAPLSWFGEISAARDPSGTDGVDLKLQGTSLFVDGARILALASGSKATSTAERLNAAGPARGVPANEVRSWIDAFDYLQLLRLRTQYRRAAGALPPSDNPNFLPLDDLSDLDRRIVRHALHQARSLQHRLELDYPG